MRRPLLIFALLLGTLLSGCYGRDVLPYFQRHGAPCGNAGGHWVAHGSTYACE
jgi:hypothetical protein